MYLWPLFWQFLIWTESPDNTICIWHDFSMKVPCGPASTQSHTNIMSTHRVTFLARCNIDQLAGYHYSGSYKSESFKPATSQCYLQWRIIHFILIQAHLHMVSLLSPCKQDFQLDKRACVLLYTACCQDWLWTLNQSKISSIHWTYFIPIDLSEAFNNFNHFWKRQNEEHLSQCVLTRQFNRVKSILPLW